MNKSPYITYGNVIFNHMTRGMADKPTEVSGRDIGIGFNKVFGKQYCTFYFQLSSFNEYCDYEMYTKFRSYFRRLYSKKCYVDFICRQKPYRVKWESNELKDNEKTWKKAKKNVKNTKERVEDEGYGSNVVNNMMEFENKKEYSWKYYQSAEQKGEAAIMHSLVFRVKIPKKDYKEVQSLSIALSSAAKLTKLNIKNCTIFMEDYISEISPFKHTSTKFAGKLVAERTQTTGVNSRLYSTNQNRLPQNKVILGNDTVSGKIVSIDTVKSLKRGSSMFIIGGTGSGKSTLLKNMNEGFLATKLFIYLTDYEENEYTAQGDRYDAKYLDVGGISGFYYEPLILNHITGVPEIDKGMYSTAVSNVCAYFSCCNKKPLTPGQELIISEAINSVMLGFDVDIDDMSTWHKTKDIRLKHVAQMIIRERYSQTAVNKYGEDLHSIANVMELYFGDKSTKNRTFRHPVSLDEYIDASMVIFKFGKDNGGGLNEDANVEIAIKQLSHMIITQTLSRIRRSRNEAFAVEFEEVQRYEKNVGSLEIMNTTFTGIRKANGFAIAVLNDPSLLSESLKGLIQNTRYLLVGRLDDTSVLEELYRTPKLAGCKHLVESVSKTENAFLLNSPEQTSIFKVEIPDYMMNGPIYKTVDVKDAQGNAISD